MKNVLKIIFLLLPSLMYGQTTLIGFDAPNCSNMINCTYTYNNWTSGTGGGYNGGVEIFKNGTLVSEFTGSLGNVPQCAEMIFINDSVGFIVNVVANARCNIYKTSDYAQNWIDIGQHSPNCLGAYVVNENFVYLITELEYSGKNIVWVTKCSDIQSKKEIIIDEELNAPININDTIINNSLCDIDSLKIFIQNDLDTITYNINFMYQFTGIEKSNDNINTIKLFPNPASDYLNIQYRQQQIEKICILDMSGNKIRTFKQNTSKISLANLPKGIYFISFIGSQKTITKKFVIR